MEKFYILTLGCKVNAYESSSIREILLNEGYEEVKDPTLSTICIINTCSVTHVSDSKSRQMIRKVKKTNKDAIIVVMGCYAQVSKEVVKEIDGVNVVIGTKNRHKIVEYINKYKETGELVDAVEEYKLHPKFEEMGVTPNIETTRAYLKIQDGCNNFCTYCIIPYTRGGQRSRSKEEIFKELEKLEAQGFKEIVFTGIHSGSYGFEFDNYRLSDLLVDCLERFKKIERIRISSIEIIEIDDKFIELLKTNKVIAKHLHIPLQSGSDEILKKMNRHYNVEEFIKMVEKIREADNDVCLTTDVICGFPGESEEHFNEMLENIKKINFAKLHVFPYSPRSGTVASKMPNQIDPKIKKERVNKLLSLSRKLEGAYIEKFLNKEEEVIFETIDEDNNLVGHTSNYLKVMAKGDKSYINQVKKVRLVSFLDGIIQGIIL